MLWKSWAALRESAGWIRQHPIILCALAGALVVSVGGVFCGFGVVAAPWFACELFAQQLGIATGRTVPRTRAWVGAALFQVAAVIVVAFAAWVATVGFGGDMPVGLSPAASTARVPTFVLAIAGGILAVLFMVPFLYSPLSLIDFGGTPADATLASIRLIVQEGFFPSVVLTVVSHVVQLAPVLIAATWVAVAGDVSDVPLAAALSIPFAVVTVALGQGMIVSTYVRGRSVLATDTGAPVRSRPPRLLAFGLTSAGAAPLVALLLVGVSLAWPSRPRPGSAPPGGDALGEVEERGAPLFIAGTGLGVSVVGGTVRIEGEAGSGVGAIPAPKTDRPVTRARVVRFGDSYAVEMVVGPRDDCHRDQTTPPRRCQTRTYTTWISAAGVRLDDDLQARFVERVPLPWLPALLFGLAVTPVALVLGLGRFARAVWGPGDKPSRASAIRVAYVALLLLLPIAVIDLALGVMALTGR